MATLTDRYVQALVKYNDSLQVQNQAKVQAEYDAWKQKKNNMYSVNPTQTTSPATGEDQDVEPVADVIQAEPVSDVAKNDAISAAGITNLGKNIRKTAAELAKKYGRTLFDNIVKGAISYTNDTKKEDKTSSKPTKHSATSNSSVNTQEIPYVKASPQVTENRVARDFDDIQAYSNRRKTQQTISDSMNQVVMDKDGNVDVDSVKKNARATLPAREELAKQAKQEKQKNTSDLTSLSNFQAVKEWEEMTKDPEAYEQRLSERPAKAQLDYYGKKWLNPSYKMTDEDIEKFYAISKQWNEENPKAAQAYNDALLSPKYYDSGDKLKEVSKEYPDIATLESIKNKLDPYMSTVYGATSAYTPWQEVGGNVVKAFGSDSVDKWVDEALEKRKRDIQNAYAQHERLASVGRVGGEISQYALWDTLFGGLLGEAYEMKNTYKAAKDAKAIAKEAGLGVGKQLASGAKAGGSAFLHNLALQTIPDLAIDVGGNAIVDANNGESASTIAGNSLNRFGQDVLINSLLELGGFGAGFAGDKLKNSIFNSKANTGIEPPTPPDGGGGIIDDATKNLEDATKTADDVTQIIDDAAKNVDETKPIIEDTKNLVDDTKAVADDTKPIIEDTRSVADDVKPIAEDTKPIVDDTRNIVDETKNLDNSTKTIAEDTGLRPDELTFNPEKELTGQSRVVTNSALNADVVTAKEIADDPIIKDIMEYEKHSNSVTLTDALDRFERNGQRWKDDFISGKEKIANDTDVDTAMLILQDLKKKADKLQGTDQYEAVIAERNALLRKLREFGTEKGQAIQAFAKWNNTADGALLTATGVENDVVRSWAKKNQKAIKGNARIAQALEDMGNVWKETAEKKVLTHDEVVEGVRRELEKEFSGIEGLFNDEDIEFLARLAEDRKIPVWQITDEIEHKLKHGEWYTLDESIAPKMPTNTKLNNALNALVEGEVRQAPKAKPTLQQITDEVRNTVRKESASFDNFTEDDIAYLANLINNGASKQDIVSALNTKLATGRFGISAETQQKVNDLFKYAEQFDPNSKQFVEAQAEALRLLADEVVPKATALEKFEAWRYMAMLGNPKTMLRNYIGNKTFGLVTGISNNLAALGEATVDRASKKFGGEGIQRTKSVLNLKNDRGLIDAAKADADISRYRQMAGSKYEKIDKDALRRSKSVFDSKIAQLYEKAVDAGISDYSAIKGKYSTSLAGYLKANGFDKSIFEAEGRLARLRNLAETRVLTPAERNMMTELADQVKALDKGRDFALKQAEYATFHEDNAIASLLTKWSKDARDSDHLAANAMGMVIEGTVPFKKTPANVLRSGLEYSPLGAIDSIRKTGKLIYENTGKRAGNLADTYTVKKLFGKGEKEVNKTLAADVIDSWSKTLTGTSMTALGAYLYNKGIIQVSDADTKAQDQLEGKQNYSIIINGKSYTIDWAAPAVMPLLLGAEISKVREETAEPVDHWYENIDNYMNAIGTIAEPIVETSYLSGVRNAFEDAADAAQYGGKDVALSLLANAGLGYATQGIPTLFGQVARTVDNTRRSTYTDKEGIARTFERQLNKIENKIPFLSMTNDPYVDSYGRQQKNGPTDNPLLNLGYQMLSPGYLQSVNVTPADELSRRVYEETGKEDTGILPVTQYGLKIDGEKATPEQFTEFSKVYGNANYEIRDALAGSDWFNKLDATEQAEILSSVNTLAKNVGKSAVDENFTSSDKALEAYQNGGTEGLIQYYRGKNALGTIGAGPTSRVGEYIMNADDPDKAAKEISKATDMMKSTGLLDKKADYPTADLMDKYEELGYKGLKDYGNAVKEARKAGVMGENSTTMPESVQEFYDNYGVDGVKDYASAMDTLRKNGLLKEDSKSLPKEVREIYAQSGMKGVNDYVTIETNQKGASYSGYQKIQGQIPYLTATEYNNIYNQFSVPTESGNYNATFSKDAELIPFLTSRTWSNDNELNIYAHALAPSVEGTWHIKNNQLYYNKPSVEKWNG